MTRNKKKYHRLPGKKKSFLIGYYTLWQAADHLLLVYSRFGVEDYKRFYFADIQSIITHKTATGKIQNLVLSVFLLVFGLMIFTLDGGLAIFGGIMTACCGIFLIINCIRGPTCVTHLQTAVQTEKLHSLFRLKIAHKVMDRLRPLIGMVQGRLTSEDLKPNNLNRQKPSPTLFSSTPPKRSAKPLRIDSGVAHLSLFSLMLFDGLLVILNANFQMTAITLLSTLASMGIGVCVVIALVKQRESNMPKTIRNLTWTGLGFVCASFLLGYVFTMVLAFKNPEIMGNQWKIVERVAAMSFFDNPFVGSLNILALCGAFGLGIPGLILVDKHRKTLKRSVVKANASPGISSPLGNQ
jgi:hypothetical protein